MIKKVLTIIISLALVIGGISFVAPQKLSADTDFAITAPTKDSLRAAGYIDIKWEDASSINEVENYDVFIDGSLVNTTTDLQYEFYTTKVYFHKVWIRANFKDGTNHYTKSVKFGVTKKGLGVGSGMGPYYAKVDDMKIGWYYNWGTVRYGYPKYANLEYVPMVWGDQDADTIQSKVDTAVSRGYKYILGFNEPDIKGDRGGCNMPTQTAIDLWPNFLGKNIRVGSPAYGLWSSTGKSEFPTFMAGIDNQVDFVCIHCYPADWNGGSEMARWFLESVVDDTYNRYHKPIWITEYSTSGNGITQAGTSSFIKYLLPGLDERDYVERQAFFSMNAASFGGGLWNYTNGELSQSGEAYAQYGNPEYDYVTGYEVNPRDAEDETTTEPTTAKPTAKPTVKPTTTKVTKPGKVKIKKAKNDKKRKISLKFKKVAGANGYEVMYSDSKKFDGYWLKNTKKTKITLKKLDRKTKYYIKVRAYKLVNKNRLYGDWSKKKKVKVKK